jgi:hypothetical protein
LSFFIFSLHSLIKWKPFCPPTIPKKIQKYIFQILSHNTKLNISSADSWVRHNINLKGVFLNPNCLPYLICKIVCVENHFHITSFTNKCLWLFSFATKLTRLPSIRHIGFSIAVDNL